MAAPLVYDANSLQDYTQIIEELRAGVPSGVQWYRGCGSADYTLLASLYRRSEEATARALIDLESEMLDRFEQRSIPYLDRALKDSWERLFVMQHYGIPTRLLDWSENPFIALYFAMTSAASLFSETDEPGDAAVWVLDPVAWNRKALDRTSYKGGILSTSHSHASSYAPASNPDNMNNDPVAVYPAHNSSRIVAQRGVFTISGQSLEPMEHIYDTNAYPTGALSKIRIPGAAVQRIHSSVVAIGYSASVIFPDLDGLAKELTLQFKLRR